MAKSFEEALSETLPPPCPVCAHPDRESIEDAFHTRRATVKQIADAIEKTGMSGEWSNERVSGSFSPLGQAVKNHFMSKSH